MALDTRVHAPLTIDVCGGCQAIWFDKYEDLQLSAASTLKLMKFIGDHSSQSIPPQSKTMRCPRCASLLLFTHDIARETRFTYWRCPNEHGRYIGFLDFLREKNYIRPLTPQQIQDLRQNVQTVNCCNCGAPIDLTVSSNCAHCGSPLSMLDMKQPQELLKQLQQTAETHPAEAKAAVDMVRSMHETEAWFGQPDQSWLNAASSSSLVHAGLDALSRWLAKSGIA